MTVGRKQIAERIETESKRVDLPPTDLLDCRAIGPETVGVARVHVQHVGTFAAHLHVAVVAESVVGVDPAVDPPRERVLVSVCVDNAKRAEFNLLLIGNTIAIRIFESPDIWNRPCDRFGIAERHDADGNIQVLGKSTNLLSFAVRSKVAEDANGVASLFLALCGKGILEAVGDPQ